MVVATGMLSINGKFFFLKCDKMFGMLSYIHIVEGKIGYLKKIKNLSCWNLRVF